MVDPATAAALVASPDAILALARLSAEEAEHEADADRRSALLLRALALGHEALERDEAHHAAGEFVALVAQLVDHGVASGPVA
jgi:hypothetical protein